jgi:hypothetical protein
MLTDDRNAPAVTGMVYERRPLHAQQNEGVAAGGEGERGRGWPLETGAAQVCARAHTRIAGVTPITAVTRVGVLTGQTGALWHQCDL